MQAKVRRSAAFLMLVAALGAVAVACGEDDPAPTSTAEPAAETTEASPAAPVEPTATAEDAAMDEPEYLVEIGTDSALGVSIVDAVVGVDTDNAPHLGLFVEALGEPDEAALMPDDPSACLVRWDEAGVQAVFVHFHVQTPDPCDAGPDAEGGLALLYATGDGWGTSDGISIGVDESELSGSHEEGEPVSVGFEQRTDPDTSYVLAQGTYGGKPSPALFADVTGGQVIAFYYTPPID